VAYWGSMPAAVAAAAMSSTEEPERRSSSRARREDGDRTAALTEHRCEQFARMAEPSVPALVNVVCTHMERV